MVGLKRRLWAKIKGILFLNPAMNVSFSNIGIILENKVVQTLKLENNVFY